MKILKNALYVILVIVLVLLIPLNKQTIRYYYETEKLLKDYDDYHIEIKSEIEKLKKSFEELRNLQKSINLEILDIERKIKTNSERLNNIIFDNEYWEYNQYDPTRKKSR